MATTDTSPVAETESVSAPIDLRLAIGAGCAWLAVLFTLSLHATGVLIFAVVSAVGAGLAAVVAARRVPLAGAVALAGFCTALALAPLSARLAHVESSPVADLARAGAQATVEVTVTGDPHLLAATGVAGASRVAVDAKLNQVIAGGRRYTGGGAVLVLAPAAPWLDILPGQRVRLDARLLRPLNDPLSVATISSDDDPQLLGRPPWWQRAAGVVRSSLRQASTGLPEQPRGLLPGLVDGDTSQLDPVLAQRFRTAGLTHLVAVSGTNCAIVIGTVLLVLRRVRAGPLLSAAVGAVFLVGFVVVARPSPSVLRAAMMAAIALVALATGRQREAVPLLSAAVLVLLLWNPELAEDAGFTMSALATAALLLVAPGWAAALRRRHVPVVIAESLAVAAAAHVVTAPVIAALSGRISLVSIPANMLAEPVVAAATLLGFGAAIVAPFSLTVGSGLAQLAGVPCRWLVWVGNYFGSLPGATVPWPGGAPGGIALLVATAALWWLCRRAGPRKVIAAATVVAVVFQVPVRAVTSAWPPAGWFFVACDVGQGDGLVLAAGAHAAVVVDAGPDPVAMDRCLDELAITSVPLLVFSHYHLDHVGGIDGVFHGRHVGQVITGPLADPASGVKLVATTLRQHGLTISTPQPGQTLRVGAVQLDVLGPAAPFRNTRSDPNNSSLVLRATVDGERILLPGDAEIEAQQSLLEDGLDLRADVLKVPHHGSAYSDPLFLAAVHAKVGVISVGLNNDYGHPAPLLLSEMAQIGVPVRRTDHDGDVAVVVHNGQLATVEHGTRASAVG
jgi:competence protein ComEC